MPMTTVQTNNSIIISPKSQKILKKIIRENPRLASLLEESETPEKLNEGLRLWAEECLSENPEAFAYYKGEEAGRDAYSKLRWKDFAAIRILDYIDNADLEYEDLNLRGKKDVSNPFKLLWLAYHEGVGGTKVAFFADMIFLFRQFTERLKRDLPSLELLNKWMDRHPSGMEDAYVQLRQENRYRIIKVIIRLIENETIKSERYAFEWGLTDDEKFSLVEEWWNDYQFHLKFAIKDPETLNEMLGFSLSKNTMKTLTRAFDAGIPFFVNPYYLSLINTNAIAGHVGADQAIRDYVLYSKQLIKEFGHIVAWEKEDIVEPGKPNAAGWLLPSQHNIHRRYPEVAILIPDTMGRACGGLCTSCQRMYDFQSGHLNFNLKKLKPKDNWSEKLNRLMKYYEKDSQLRDVLLTGGDGFMTSNKNMAILLDSIYQMAINKKERNEKRSEGEKHAEILRVRIGTRLPVYLPQRVDENLLKILADFKKKASAIGVKQFVIQTHFESAMEITPEAEKAVRGILAAGWTISNQQVYTTAASRRGHTAKLRKVLNDIGVITYYTFSVKGYMENYHSFATNARAIQEQIEEKVIGQIPVEFKERIKELPLNPVDMVENINKLREESGVPFLATDRNVLNLPGVGKSLTYRTIGITRQGRRILEFDHDHTRTHSPIIHEMGKVVIVESKPIKEYMNQLDQMGEEENEYINIYGYSIGETEERQPVYEYPEYDYTITTEVTNLQLN